MLNKFRNKRLHPHFFTKRAASFALLFTLTISVLNLIFSPIVYADFDFSLTNGGDKTVAAGSAVTNSVTATLTGAPSATTYVQDNFTGINSTTLSTHRPDVGGVWSYQVGDAKLLNGKVQGANWTWTVNASNTPMPSTDYDVAMDIISNGPNAGGMVLMGVTGRTIQNYERYAAFYDMTAGLWKLNQRHMNNESTIGSFAQPYVIGQTHNVRLSMVGTAIKVYIDGILRISAINSSVTAAGSPGIITNNLWDPTQLLGDNFLVTSTGGGAPAVTFSANNLPVGVSTSFSPTGCIPTCTTTMTLNTLSTTPAGTYPLTVTGTAGIMSYTSSFNLTVNAPLPTPTPSPLPTSTPAPTPSSTPNPNLRTGCGLANAAFCEDLSGGTSPGGRAGDLDDSKWSVGRVDGQFGDTKLMPFPQTPVSPCKSGVTNVNADNDIIVCDGSSNHSGQFETALGAQYYALLSLRPRQAFDFAGRTGTIAFNNDLSTTGPLGWWSSVFVTDEPIPAANDQGRVTGMTPKNGIGINFDGNNCPGALGTSLKVNNLFTYNNYAETNVNVSNGICIQTQAGLLNHVEIRLSQTNIEIWASDFSTDNGVTFPNFRQIASAPINLNFSRGYVHFQQAERAPTKYGPFNNQTYSNSYWSALGFDGPVIGAETGYAIPDALTHNPDTIDDFPNNINNLNIGYGLLNNPNSTYTCCNGTARTTIAPFTISNVNLTGITSAKLTFSIFYVAFGTSSSNYVTKYRFNGGAWKNPTPTPDYARALYCGSWCGNPAMPYDANWSMGFAFPVATGDLVPGTNTLEIASDGSSNSYPAILANIDLLTY